MGGGGGGAQGAYRRHCLGNRRGPVGKESRSVVAVQWTSRGRGLLGAWQPQAVSGRQRATGGSYDAAHGHRAPVTCNLLEGMRCVSHAFTSSCMPLVASPPPCSLPRRMPARCPARPLTHHWAHEPRQVTRLRPDAVAQRRGAGGRGTGEPESRRAHSGGGGPSDGPPRSWAGPYMHKHCHQGKRVLLTKHTAYAWAGI